MGTAIRFKRPDGREASGYLAAAKDAKAPGIIVIQEWWGVQGQIKGVCDRLAQLGYRAIAPDLYNGTVVPYHDPDAANAAMSALDFQESVDQVVRGAAQHLKAQGAKVGLTGFCLGGLVSALGAVRLPELSAAVAFYGLPDPKAGDPKALRVPLQGHFANKDDWCTPAAVDGFESAAKAAGKAVEFYRYDAAHGFTNEEQPYYNASAAKLAWDRMMTFWKTHLA
ncbi:MAG: dienelactone hydrolase family protein [Alphaproteobacteria bacterium]